MNINFQDMIPQSFPDNSRVWVYQSNRKFTPEEVLQVEDILKNFCKEWNSHGSPVKGYANLFFGQLIIIMADESDLKIGGCSTDSSIRLMKNIEKDFNIELLDRQSLAFIVKEKIQLLPLDLVNYSIENGFLTADTLYFNNTILTKKDLMTQWIIPIKESWLAGRIPSSE